MSLSDERVKLDELDYQILDVLQRDGRITNAKLAAKVGMSAPSMLERVKKLERQGVINAYRAILDRRQLNHNFIVFVTLGIDVDQLAKVSELEERLRDIPEILECHHLAGNMDFILKVNVRDQEEYKRFVVERLSRIKGIKVIQSWVALSTVKESTALPIGPQNL